MKNDRHSRRQFLGLTGSGMVTAFGATGLGTVTTLAQAPDTRDADLVVFNAKVYTVDSRLPKAEAFAVKAGRFSAVGSTADIKGLIGKSTQTFDAKQMTIVPGFTDCHNHAGGDVLLYEVLVGNPFEVEFVTIAQHHRQASREGPRRRRRARGSRDSSSTTPKSRTSAS